MLNLNERILLFLQKCSIGAAYTFITVFALCFSALIANLTLRIVLHP